METIKVSTQFAPAERAPEEEIQRQCYYFSNMPLLRRLLDAVPDILVMLNKERQTVFANLTLLDFLGLKDEADVAGLRPGEILNCIHAFKNEGGCGTTEFCKTCGAVNAILTSQQGRQDIQECRISRKNGGEALDLRVWATPLRMNSELFTLFAAVDISHEKRRRGLERIFFHDILNTAIGLRGFAELLMDTDPKELDEYIEMIYRLTERLIEEVNAQRELSAAENNELSIHPSPISSLGLLKDIVDLYAIHEVADQRHIRIDSHAEDVTFTTDKTLLGRVIGNMVKNALEASQPDENVTVGCKVLKEEVQFWVHNPNFMPRDVQLQIFQRSFSTKGAGRGLGTYSIKLLSERYLNGKVSFTTSPEQGTKFKGSYPLKLNVQNV